jgi:hypothetical protein
MAKRTKAKVETQTIKFKKYDSEPDGRYIIEVANAVMQFVAKNTSGPADALGAMTFAFGALLGNFEGAGFLKVSREVMLGDCIKGINIAADSAVKMRAEQESLAEEKSRGH